MSRLLTDIPASLKAALEEETLRSGRSDSSVVTAALAEYFKRPIHTVFQVSTSGALVAGDPRIPTESEEVWTFVRRQGGNWLLSAIQQI